MAISASKRKRRSEQGQAGLRVALVDAAGPMSAEEWTLVVDREVRRHMGSLGRRSVAGAVRGPDGRFIRRSRDDGGS